jgi:hypothetical protein
VIGRHAFVRQPLTPLAFGGDCDKLISSRKRYGIGVPEHTEAQAAGRAIHAMIAAFVLRVR